MTNLRALTERASREDLLMSRLFALLNTKTLAATRAPRSRRAATFVVILGIMALVAGIVALAIDTAGVVLVRTQLQVAADQAARAGSDELDKPRSAVENAVRESLNRRPAEGEPFVVEPNEVEVGVWDIETHSFTPTDGAGNAVRVTVHSQSKAHTLGEGSLLTRLFARRTLSQQATAVAIASPRDIAFVIDLSGSMNDDSEPCRTEIKSEPLAGAGQLQAIYEDFDFGACPGVEECVGAPLEVPANKWAYAKLTEDNGPLTGTSVSPEYRIVSGSSNGDDSSFSYGDSEAIRKHKAYAWIIDNQIARLMPNVRPAPTQANYSYWEKYLDYLISPVVVETQQDELANLAAISDSSKSVHHPGRGALPFQQDADRIGGFRNRNNPSETHESPHANWIGYRTYVQFMLDFGNDVAPDGHTFTPLSSRSPDCPKHEELTAGGTFVFGPRVQPIHAQRRALIAALQQMKERNATIKTPTDRDRVAIITFDSLTGGGPFIEQPLTDNYLAAMKVCAELEATSDQQPNSATEAGLATARDHLRQRPRSGQAEQQSNKFVVLIAGSMPDIWTTPKAEIDAYISNDMNGNFYAKGNECLNAALIQASLMRTDGWQVFPVGFGGNVDNGFLDRMARIGGTADQDGHAARGTKDPSQYEGRLTTTLEQIIHSPQVRLVE